MNNPIAPLMALLLLAIAGCERAPSASPDTWAITDVSVIDVINGRVDADQTIVIRDGRIDAITSSANADVLEGASVVRAPGTFVIPGLFDMHVHLFSSPRLAPGYIADLLVLDGNPLDDIRNTRRIRSIIWRGHLLNPMDLN